MVVLGDKSRHNHLVGKRRVHHEWLLPGQGLELVDLTHGEDAVAHHRHRLCGRLRWVKRHNLPGLIDNDLRQCRQRFGDVLERTLLGHCHIRGKRRNEGSQRGYGRCGCDGVPATSKHKRSVGCSFVPGA
jgi:hypothetical protein